MSTNFPNGHNPEIASFTSHHYYLYPLIKFPHDYHAMKSGGIIPHYLKMNGKLDAPAALPLSKETKNSLGKEEGGHQTYFTHEAADRSQLCWKFNLSSSPKLVVGITLHAYFPRSYFSAILDLLGAPQQNCLCNFCLLHPSYMS